MKFVDSSFWLGLQMRDDGHHSLAQEVWRARPRNLVTTNHVLGESWTFLRRRRGHDAAELFRQRVAASGRVRVRFVEQPTELEAWRWLERHNERPYSFVDATSFMTMRQLRIHEALAFDDDFSAAGFVEVRP